MVSLRKKQFSFIKEGIGVPSWEGDELRERGIQKYLRGSGWTEVITEIEDSRRDVTPELNFLTLINENWNK